MLEIIIIFVLGFLIGWRCCEWLRMAAISQLFKDLGIKEQDLRRVAELHGLDIAPEHAASMPTVGVRLEQDQGQIYAYRTDTAEFLGQGADPEALILRLNENLKPCRVVVAQEDGADLLRKNNT